MKVLVIPLSLPIPAVPAATALGLLQAACPATLPSPWGPRLLPVLMPPRPGVPGMLLLFRPFPARELCKQERLCSPCLFRSREHRAPRAGALLGAWNPIGKPSCSTSRPTAGRATWLVGGAGCLGFYFSLLCQS